MISLTALSSLILLLVPLSAAHGGFVNNLRAHYSDVLKLKCDALPFRTTYTGTKCYFIVNEKMTFEKSAEQCTAIFKGAEVATRVSPSIFEAMKMDGTQFHENSDSTEAKKTICVYDSLYQCGGDRSTRVPGKCLMLSANKALYPQAVKYCATYNLELPNPSNDDENRLVAEAITDPAWTMLNFDKKKWLNGKSFGRFGTCSRLKEKPPFYLGNENAAWKCRADVATVIQPDGYWTNSATNIPQTVICVKNAASPFWNDPSTKRACAANHELDVATGHCKWLGPPDACVQLIAGGKTMYVTMPGYPNSTFREIDLWRTRSYWNDRTVKAIVRYGCMSTGYCHSTGGKYNQESTLYVNRAYGVHDVASRATGTLSSWPPGLTRVQCFCDPTVAGGLATNSTDQKLAVVNRDCIEHHVFNEQTQTCEWTKDNKYCAELINSDGKRMLLEIKNWPKNTKYDVNHWSHFREFSTKLTNVTVRQHCWVTLYNGGAINSRRTLATSGYGHYPVVSYYNKLGKKIGDGTTRVQCDCLY